MSQRISDAGWRESAAQVTALAATAVAAFNNQQEKTMTQATHITEREQYLQDCRETDKPWERWEFCDLDGQWYSCITEPGWNAARQYRRKQEPKKYIRIGDALVPAPIREASVESYWIVSSTLNVRCVYVEGTISAGTQQSFFDSGMAYATEADAQRAADALRKLLTQTPFTRDAIPKPTSMAVVPTPLQEKPAHKTSYYTVTGASVHCFDWVDDPFDRSRLDMGLVFDTQEKAEQAIAVIRNLFRPQAA